jgi:hypothetical protein
MVVYWALVPSCKLHPHLAYLTIILWFIRTNNNSHQASALVFNSMNLRLEMVEALS